MSQFIDFIARVMTEIKDPLVKEREQAYARKLFKKDKEYSDVL